MSTKEEVKTKKKINQSLLVVGLMLGLSVLLNFYFYQKLNNVTIDEPNAVKSMGSKYQSLLESMPEEKAQAELIDWLKQDSLILKVEKTDNGNGLYVEYCTESKGTAGNSWYNLKTVK